MTVLRGMDAGVTGEFAGLRVCVTGLGVSGPPAAAALAGLGAQVTVVDGRADEEQRRLAAGTPQRPWRCVVPEARRPVRCGVRPGGCGGPARGAGLVT